MEYNGVGWGLTEDEDDDKDGFWGAKRYVMVDGAWHDCPEDLWDVIVAGLAARNEAPEESPT